MPHDRRYERHYSPYREPRRATRSPYRGDEMLSSIGGERFYTDFERMGWGEAPEGEQYYGTGSYYGGGFATAPGTRASGEGVSGAPGYAGQGAWSDLYRVDARGFSGRGPKGYRRSDQRLQEVICDRLTDDPRIDASDISVEVRDQIVRLTGSVEDRRTKYDVEELVERSGANEIDNQLRVQTNRWR